MKLALIVLVAISAMAQMRDNRDKKLTCENKGGNSDRVRSCKISEQTLSALGRLVVEAGHNGGVSVAGWTGNQTLVRARVETWAPTESEASLLAGQIQVETASGLLRATGPKTEGETGWAVTWEVFSPHNTDLKLTAHNGGVHVSDIRGRLEAKTHNGGVHLARVMGEVSGSSHNGGIHVEMAPGDNSPLSFDTHNGGIHLSLPKNYSANVHAETHQGGIHSDFPLPAVDRKERRARNIDFVIGSGGPQIRVKTHNGGVHIQKL